jgi:hypothetical protein
LAEAGVGAISLASISSPFRITAGAADVTVGQVRATGLVAMEDGLVASIQHVDLAV